MRWKGELVVAEIDGFDRSLCGTVTVETIEPEGIDGSFDSLPQAEAFAAGIDAAFVYAINNPTETGAWIAEHVARRGAADVVDGAADMMVDAAQEALERLRLELRRKGGRDGQP